MSDGPAVIAKNLARVPIADLVPHPENPRRGNVEAIRESIRANGYYKPITAQRSTGMIIAGRHSWDAAQAEGITSVPVVWLDVDDATAKRIMLADNRTADLATYDEQILADALASLEGLAGTGYDEDALASLRGALDDLDTNGGMGGGIPGRGITGGQLAREFGVPPFSVLDTRQGYWQARKREWLALGLRSELGRGDVMPSGASSVGMGTAPDGSKVSSSRLNGRGKARAVGQDLMAGEHVVGGDARRNITRKDQDAASNVTGAPPLPEWADNGVENMAPGTSIFDPVLCELSYRWYSSPGARVLDPFAGGSVRGIVAAYCDRSYVGVDLRPEQVAANEAQWQTISAATPPPGTASPEWRVGDSRHLADIVPDAPFDLLFSCPPYYDLEVYSDDPDDLSRAASYEDFLAGYEQIIAASAERLRDDRFAVLVVSEIRDPKGLYRGFIPDTIRACAKAGLALYNEAALVNMVGSLPLRVRRQFSAARKLGRTHQAVLTFVKGSPEEASRAAGPVFVPDLDYDDATGVASGDGFGIE